MAMPASANRAAAAARPRLPAGRRPDQGTDQNAGHVRVDRGHQSGAPNRSRPRAKSVAQRLPSGGLEQHAPPVVAVVLAGRPRPSSSVAAPESSIRPSSLQALSLSGRPAPVASRAATSPSSATNPW